jgi:hypothetical protein
LTTQRLSPSLRKYNILSLSFYHIQIFVIIFLFTYLV